MKLRLQKWVGSVFHTYLDTVFFFFNFSHKSLIDLTAGCELLLHSPSCLAVSLGVINIYQIFCQISVCLCMLSHFGCVQLFAMPWTAACQAPLSIGFSKQECWSGLPCPPPGDLPNQGIEPGSPPLKAESLQLKDSAFRILLPGPGLEFGLWQRKWGVLTVGPPEKSQQALLYNSNSSFTSFPQCDCFKCGLFLWDGYPYICSTDLLQGLIVKHVQSSQHGAWPTLDMQYMVKSRQCQFYPPPISCLWFIRLMSAFSIRLKTLRRKRPGLFRYCYIPKVQERCILFRLR